LKLLYNILCVSCYINPRNIIWILENIDNVNIIKTVVKSNFDLNIITFWKNKIPHIGLNSELDRKRLSGNITYMYILIHFGQRSNTESTQKLS
jgi:hypothetical protein